MFKVVPVPCRYGSDVVSVSRVSYRIVGFWGVIVIVIVVVVVIVVVTILRSFFLV